MNQWFEHLVEQISLVGDETAANDVLAKLTLTAGFRNFAYVSLQPGTYNVISNYPDLWKARYIEKAYVSVDPVMKGLRQRTSVFHWAPPVGRVSKERRQFFAEAAEFGIRSGISVPINAGFGHTAVFTLSSDDAEFAGTQSVDPVQAAGAFGQVHARLDAMHMMPKLRTPIRLKPDELTCLKWSAEGKSMRAIATIEDTSYANVCFHLRNAKQALGASTLPQATSIATALGLV